MYKKSLIALTLIGLSACGSSDSPDNNGNTPAVIAGTDSASMYNTESSVTESLTITDVDTGENVFIVQTDTPTDYGTFSITEEGTWTYTLDTNNSEVVALASGSSLSDSVVVTSYDGTTHTILLTIEAGLNVYDLPDALLTVPIVECTTVYNNVSNLEYAAEEASDDLDDVSDDTTFVGKTLCLADGTYEGGLDLKFGHSGGTESEPFKIAAETPGKVIFSGGTVGIEMHGSYTQLQGFVFENVEYSSSLISTRWGTQDLCYDCRITDMTIVNATATGTSGILVHIYGKNIWLDHSIISGKTVKNPMISFNRWVSSTWGEDEIIAELAQGIVVYGNYIANRPPADEKMYASSDDNDYEAIRTGLSDTHQYPGNSMVIGNLFENIQGEAEVISNKASNNVIAQNTVRNSYGSITNRHGNTNVIDNNFIIGDGYPFAGGLRIVDDGHTITNNYIEGARYQATSHHGGIVILGSDGSGDSDNGYQQVENVHIAHNTVVNSVNSVNIDGGGKDDQPQQVYFANNIIDQAVGSVFVDTERGVSSDSYYSGNIVYSESGSLADTDEITAAQLGATLESGAILEIDDAGIYRPNGSASLEAGSYEKGGFADVEMDMDGTSRGDATEVGADDINNDTAMVKLLTYDDVGPSYEYEKPIAIMIEETIVNADFEDGVTGWTGLNENDIITVTDGAFAGHSLSRQGSEDGVTQSVDLTANTNYAISAFVKGVYLMSVNEHVFEGELTSSDYSYVIHEFTTDTDENSGEITLQVAENVVLNAGVVDGNLGLFRANSGSSDYWVKEEGNTANVGSSGDTAFTDSGTGEEDGSARVRFQAGTDTSHDFEDTPGLSQVLSNVPTGVDLTYSLYYCDNKGDDSLTTLHYGIKDSTGNVVAEAYAHTSDLDNASEGTVKDCFKQVTLELPNNSNENLEIFAFIEVDIENNTVDEILASDQFTGDDLEVRLDEFSLTYKGSPSDDSIALFDEIRLVKRVD